MEEYLKRFDRKSYYNKTNDWYKEIAKEIIHSADSPDYKRWVQKCKINYGLYNARGIESTLKKTPYRLSHEEFKHNDIISYISRSMVGDQMDRPFKYSVVDTSNYAFNSRQEQRIRSIMEVFNQRYVKPIEQQEILKYQIENGIKDVYKLTPQERQQMEADVQNRVQQVLPSEIKRIVSGKVQAPTEKQVSAIMRVVEEDQKLKFKTDLGFENGVITGLEAYRLGIFHQKPVVDLVNPSGFSFFKADNKFFFHEAEWVVYREEMGYTDFLERFGNDITPALLKKIEEKEFYVGNNTYDYEKGKIISVVVQNEDFFDKALKDVDFRTPEGQRVLGNLYNMYGRTLDSLVVPVTHVNFKAPRKFLYVTGNGYQFWADETYAKRAGEKVEVFWGVESYEVYMVGEIDNDLFLKMEATPYQYMTPNNPFYTTLSYYGAEYSALSGNTEPVSSIDLGKPGQFRFNRQVKLIEKTLARDHGKVLSLIFTAKPDEYSEEQWLSMMKDEGILIVDPSKITVQDAQYFFKELNLSQDDKLASQIAYLDKIKEETAAQMYYNSARLGVSEERTAVRNNLQNIQQSVSQTRPVYYIHDMIVQSMLNGLVNYARIAFLTGSDRLSYVLDDKTVADIVIDKDKLWSAELGVHVVGLGDSTEALYMYKNQALAFLQNNMISPLGYSKIMGAKSFSEIVEIMEEENETQQVSAEANQQMLMQQAQQAQEFQMELIKLKAQMDALVQQPKLQTNREIAMTNSMLMANAQDIDEDGKSDSVENSDRERLFKMRESEKDRQLKREEISAKIKISSMKPKTTKK